MLVPALELAGAGGEPRPELPHDLAHLVWAGVVLGQLAARSRGGGGAGGSLRELPPEAGPGRGSALASGCPSGHAGVEGGSAILMQVQPRQLGAPKDLPGRLAPPELAEVGHGLLTVPTLAQLKLRQSFE